MTEAATALLPLKDELVTTRHLIEDDDCVPFPAPDQTGSNHHAAVATIAVAKKTHILEDLPLHLLRHILCQLPTIRCLASVALSHRSFYEAYHDDPLGIMCTILDAQIPSGDMRRYCAAACVSKSIDCSKAVNLTTFLSEHISGNTNTNTNNTTNNKTGDQSSTRRRLLNHHVVPGPAERSLVEMSDLHVVVDYFTRDFLEDAAEPAYHVFGGECFDGVPSEEEVLRVQRALYVFHVYCVLFSGASRTGRVGFGFSLTLLRDELFGAFSPWAREQIVSIFEYMERVARRGTRHVKTENLGWDGHMRASMTPMVPNEAGEAFLSKGLESFYALDNAPDDASKSRILFPTNGNSIININNNNNNDDGNNESSLPSTPTPPLIRFPSVYLELASGAYFHLSVPIRSKELQQWQEDELLALEKPATDGVDGYLSPPFVMWARAHRRYVVGVSVRLPRYKALRRAGYVFWDARPFLLDEGDIQARFARAVRWREEAVVRGLVDGEEEEEVVDGWWPDYAEVKRAARDWAAGGSGYRSQD